MFKKSLAQAYHDFSTLLGAGVPLLRSLDNISHSRGRIGRAFGRVRESVAHGDPMASAMQDERVFEPFDVTAVRVGETSGDLPETLRELGRWYDFTYRMKMLILTGCIYPAFVFHAGALIGPIAGLALGGGGLDDYVSAVVEFLSTLYVPAIVILLAIKLMPRRGTLRLIFDTLVAYIPVVGKTMERVALSRFTWAFHVASRSGVPYLDGMQLALDMTGNEAVARKLGGGLTAVRAGDRMSEGFSRSLPFDFVEIWKVGEETGDMDEVTGRLAEQMQFSAETRIQILARVLTWTIYIIVMLLMIGQIFQAAGAIRNVYTI